ncbi:Extracellular matrix-binding ebh, putative [Babesia ovata]|uniref:Extracellular matrix-binding ebh, putative n=1 Tax=Babesia ovata TaxID=189622 RepID=A0A2H6KDD9_9APIC|nr:Extracellular matrix-binding ebh, putative [Babesia ovata]GBE61006.1 Extracellular matrix-binding ebh, putative [Babesia ovata]
MGQVSGAKRVVGENVTKALQAVVDMNTSLMMDLKAVREKIKLEITDVITSLEVETLDKKVRDDLKTLKQRIEKLNEQVEPPGGLVSGQLEQLKNAEEEFNQKTNPITMETRNLDQNFKSAIQQPLSKAVQAVDSAIGNLGGNLKLSGGDEKKLEKIFGYIKDKVGNIKGTPGSLNGDGGKGLDGINQKIGGLARAFVPGNGQNGFNARVDGWLEGVIGNNGQGANSKPGLKAVNSWIKAYNGRVGKQGVDVKGTVKEQIMKQAEISQAVEQAQKIIDKIKDNINQNNITENLTAIKEACDKFVEKLDEKLTNNKIGELATTIAGKIQDPQGLQRSSRSSTNPDSDLTTAVRATLLALCGGVKHTSDELNFLGISVFGNILDKIKPTVDGLHDQLTAATTTNSFPPGQPESPARAVDSKLEAVRDEVTGLTATFTGSVTNNLTAAVSKLPQAVTAFNTVAQAQIKGAAKETIKAAADQIQMDSGGNIKLEENGQMSNFETAHKMIRNTDSGLQPQLQGKVEEHIGEDDTAVGTGGGAEKVKIEKGKFTHYEKHITQPLESGKTLEGKQDEGLLPEAIGSIKSVGLAELKIIEPVVGGRAAEITQQTFAAPFIAIEKELEDIKKLVDGASFMDDNGRGVRVLLEELKSELGNKNGNGFWYVFPKAFEDIKKANSDLHNTKFTTGLKQIDTAVQAVRKELKGLWKVLQNKYGDKSAVIDVLQDLRDAAPCDRSRCDGKDAEDTVK